jgi:hypothetical protein
MAGPQSISAPPNPDRNKLRDSGHAERGRITSTTHTNAAHAQPAASEPKLDSASGRTPASIQRLAPASINSRNGHQLCHRVRHCIVLKRPPPVCLLR